MLYASLSSNIKIERSRKLIYDNIRQLRCLDVTLTRYYSTSFCTSYSSSSCKFFHFCHQHQNRLEEKNGGLSIHEDLDNYHVKEKEVKKENKETTAGWQRYKIGVSYNGSVFTGFQRQNHVHPESFPKVHRKNINNNVTIDNKENNIDPSSSYTCQSVQALLEEACYEFVGKENVLHFYGSSRTDKGVHALRNVFHVDLLRRGRRKIVQEKSLPKDIEEGANQVCDPKLEESSSICSTASSVQDSNSLFQGAICLPHNAVTVHNALNAILRDREQIKRKQLKRDPVFSYEGRRISKYQRNRLNELLKENTNGFINKIPSSRNIRIIDVEMVDSNIFHARYSARGRRYLYRLVVGTINPLEDARAWCIDGHNMRKRKLQSQKFNVAANQNSKCENTTDMGDSLLDLRAMQRAASYLEGTHDFSSFRGADCMAKSPIRTISKILIYTVQQHYTSYPIATTSTTTISKENQSKKDQNSCSFSCDKKQSHDEQEIIHIEIEAPSFLYHQVRNIVGALYSVGAGKICPEDVKTILASKDRSKAPLMAPAHGLYLIDVIY